MSDARLTPKAKPRIAIMGEFSAGKSTLCNLLLKARPLPEKVTATRLSPVWMTKGPGHHCRVTLEGEKELIGLDELNDIPVEETRYIQLFLEAEILDHCDFIDFPGISDPNMDAEVWERVLTEADAVIWLTHATQAWRQTEAAVWETVPEAVRKNSVLLITRFDKLVTELDRRRVIARVEKEAGPEFDSVFPISLVEALAGMDNYDQWQASGAEDFMEHMVELMGRLAEERAANEEGAPAANADAAPDAPKAPKAEIRLAGPDKPVVETAPEPARIVPRRVRPAGGGRRERPGGLGLKRG